MPNNLAVVGANPGKQTKAAPIYTGRFFSGINTNRSPLRDARGTRYEEKFIGPAGDALIDGSNLEVTNRLTLGRRPGNPIYDTVNEWQNILSFDDFRISKALPDIFGEVTEQIDIMVSEGPDVGGYEPGNASLSAINSVFQKQVGAVSPNNVDGAVWSSSSSSAGQAYGVQVGNEWYFGNGVDNKKWLQSLFVRSSSNNSQNLPINTYPFMSTFYIDPNNNIQQLIGAIAQSTNQNPPASPNLANIYIKSISVSDNTLTITVNAAPYNAPGNPPIPIGTQYIIWSSDNNPSTGQFGVNGALAFLQGMTITTLTDWTAGGGGFQTTSAVDWPDIATTNVTQQTYPNFAALQIEQGGAASVNNTVLFGASVPSWGTQVPSAIDNFSGSITFDGQAIWVNRGETVENWGIVAPTGDLSTPGDITTFGAAAGNWQAGTYYAPASIAQASDGNLWMVTTPGYNAVGSALPTGPTTSAKKYDIYTVNFQSVPGTVIFGTEHVGTNVSIGDVFQVSRLRVTNNPANATVCNTPPLILASSLVFTVTAVSNTPADGASSFITATCATSTGFPTNSGVFGDAGYMWLLPQNSSVAHTLHQPDVYPPTASLARGQAQWTYIQTSASLTWAPNTHYYEDDFVISGSDYQMLYKGVQPFIHSFPGSGAGTITTSPAWAQPAYPVTTYFFSNGNTGTGNPTFSGNGGAWPDFGYNPGPSVTAPTPAQANSLWMATWNGSGTYQQQPSSLQTSYVGDGETGDLYFYYTGGNAYLNISGSPGVTTAPEDSGIGSGPYGLVTIASIYAPLAGYQYTINLDHNSGGFYGFVGQAISGTAPIGSIPGGSPAYGINNLVGMNTRVPGSNEGHVWSDAATVTFGATGCYQLEIDLVSLDGSDRFLIFTFGGTWINAAAPQNIFGFAVGQDLSWTNSNFSSFSSSSKATPPPSYNTAPFINEVSWAQTKSEGSGIYWWQNIGPTANYAYTAGIPVTASGTGILYNGSEFVPYTGGISGTSVPNTNFASATTIGQVVPDSSGSLEWMYIGPGQSTSASTSGTITALGPQGFIYGIALVNTLDNTVSNLGTTNEINGVGIEIVGGKIYFAPGAGLVTADIDPQADYVAIFRTTANGSIELLVPSNGNTIYTVPLVQYLQYGYLDNTQDASLDILIQGASAQQNTPPLPGAANLTYFLNRIWYSVGNTVFYTTGSSDPSGNGINGTTPGTAQAMTSRVTKLVPSSVGMLVFTLSDVNVIPISNGAILPWQPYIPGVGLSSYNALDVKGTLIGFLSTDHQFLMFNPAVGCDDIGHPIGNLLRMNIDEPGMDWNPANAYVAWYVNGEDAGWFLADGTFGWYRLVDTPAPEKGEAWSPFATINPVTTYGYAGQGCGAIKAVEVEPGVHDLLIGPALLGDTEGYGSILYRNLDASTDGGSGTYNGGPLTNGTTYPAYGVFGSYVVAHPGQVAMINFITTDQVNTGSPCTLGVIFDEALPYYTGSFDILKVWETDPPNLPESSSILGQRFYMSEAGDGDTAAMCRHCQILIQWPAESALNELQSFTIFGSFGQQG